MNIHLMAESKVFKKDYKYPVSEGVFYGTLQGASWATHSILHTYWVLDNGEKIDCPLFRDTRPKDIDKLPDNTYAALNLIKASSGKIYLRSINPVNDFFEEE